MNFTPAVIKLCTRNSELFSNQPGWGVDSFSCGTVQKFLSEAKAFLLPNNAEVGLDYDRMTREHYSLVKMPYPVVVFEYEYDYNGKQAKAVVLLVSGPRMNELVRAHGGFAQAGPNHISCYFARSVENAAWEICPYTVSVMDVSNLDDFVSVDGVPRVTMGTFLPNSLRVRMGNRPAMLSGGTPDFTEEEVDYIQDVLDPEFGTRIHMKAAMRALILLNARNITYLEVSTKTLAPKSMQRRPNGVFIDYKVLDVFLSESVRKLRSGRERTEAIREALKSQSYMRLHAVRGHFKRRKTGLFWWSPFMRGHAENGVTIKDYNVKAD